MFKKYAYGWITLAFFAVSFALHWYFGWQSYVDDALVHGQQPDSHGYLMEMGRDTFENWQSEFLQLLWQVAGLAYFLYVGSPTSKENDDRVECKIDALLEAAGRKDLIETIDNTHFRHHGHAKPHSFEERMTSETG